MKSRLPLVVFFLSAVALAPATASAHCDTLDGPVVRAARTALESGKLEPVLAWVQPGDEPEIRQAFASARAVRKGSADARALADRWFFETLVRVHRAGEGAPFTGLKPAGTPEPAVAAADRVVSGEGPEALERLLMGAVRDGLHAHLARLGKERPPASDVAAGRRWVAAYVPFVHGAEAVHGAAAGTSAHAAHGAAGHADHAEGAPEAANEGPGHADHR